MKYGTQFRVIKEGKSVTKMLLMGDESEAGAIITKAVGIMDPQIHRHC